MLFPQVIKALENIKRGNSSSDVVEKPIDVFSVSAMFHKKHLYNRRQAIIKGIL